MEMTKNKSTAQPSIPRSPFSSTQERQELERALLDTAPSAPPPPPPAVERSASSATSNSAASSHQNFVPTAVPIGEDTFDETNGVPVVAVATPTMVSLPPPPAGASSAASRMASSLSHRTNHHESRARQQQQQFATKKSEKSDSYMDDDDVIVRPEPPSYKTNDNNNTNYAFPTAPAFPTHATHLPSTEQHTVSSQLRAANAVGAILSDEERLGVARAQRHGRTVRNYHDNEAVAMANRRAAAQARAMDEGLTVDEGVHRLSLDAEEEDGGGRGSREGTKGREEEDDHRPYGNKKQQPGKGGGYEVNEYDVSEYETREYDVTEYKSVYE
mmetsp:Transcript_4825/g.8999  ORF Transcript_4825/g.8999 Transcript_4825/m.8999 type:complete len:329 (-) Transcript_4825:246-1232(-)